MKIGQFIVIQSHESQERHVQITNMMDALNGLGPCLIRCANRMPSVHSSPGKPDGHRMGIMISPICGTASDTVIGRTSEFTAPNHQSFFEHSPFFKISQKASDGFVDLTNKIAVGPLDVIVRVPSTGVELNETDSLLHQPPCQKTLAAKRLGFRLPDSIALLRGCGLLIEVQNLRNLHLHTEGKFIRLHPGRERFITRMLVGMFLVQPCQQIEILSLVSRSEFRSRSEIKDGGALGTECGSLKMTGKETIAPVGGPSLRIRNLWQHHVSRQILVHRPQTISHPGANSRITRKSVSRIELVHGGGMIH